MKKEELLLKDAIHTAIVTHRKNLVLKTLLYISLVVNVGLLVILGICL